MTKNVNITVQSLNHKEKFKLAHKIAKKLEGNYSVRLKMAWEYIKQGDNQTINNLFNKPLRLLTASEQAEPIKQNAIITKKGKKIEGVRKVKTVKEDTISITWEQVLQKLEGAPFYNFPNVDSETVHYFIKYEMERLSNDDQKIQFLDGIEGLAKIDDYQLFTTYMITFFLKTTIKSKAYRLLEYGINYKNLEKRTLDQLMFDFNYENAPSTSGKISLFDIDDVYNELVENSMRLDFGEKMFTKNSHVHQTLFFRIKNAIRTQLKAIDYNMVKTSVSDMLNYIDSMVTIDKPLEEKVSDRLDEMELTDIERDIIELRYRGYKNKEINNILSKKYQMKRFDRHFYKAQEKLGMTRNWEFAN